MHSLIIQFNITNDDGIQVYIVFYNDVLKYRSPYYVSYVSTPKWGKRYACMIEVNHLNDRETTF